MDLPENSFIFAEKLVCRIQNNHLQIEIQEQRSLLDYNHIMLLIDSYNPEPKFNERGSLIKNNSKLDYAIAYNYYISNEFNSKCVSLCVDYINQTNLKKKFNGPINQPEVTMPKIPEKKKGFCNKLYAILVKIFSKCMKKKNKKKE